MNAEIRKISVDVRKTRPIPGIQYGSQSYSASVEAEVTVDPGDDTDAMVSLTKQMLDGLKEMLNEKVDGWFEDTKGDQDDRDEASATKHSPAPGQATEVPATEKQVDYILHLAPDTQAICERYNVACIDLLTVAQASAAIDWLKSSTD